MRDVKNGLSDAVMAAFPVAIIYFSGWAYLSAYLAEFDIDATQVEIPWATVLVYAFQPLSSVRVLLTLFLLGMAYLICRLNKTLLKPVSRLAPVIFLAATIALLLVIRSASSSEAEQMANLVWHGQKSITSPVLAIPDKPDAAYDELKKCSGERRLRQVIGIGEKLFLLCRNKQLPCWYAILYALKDDGTILYYAEKRREDDGNLDSCPA